MRLPMQKALSIASLLVRHLKWLRDRSFLTVSPQHCIDMKQEPCQYRGARMRGQKELTDAWL
jgi:hypothetical protein